MRETLFAIYFVLDRKDYAFRVWPGVPRIGDRVMMHTNDGPRTHEVLEVVWGVREEEESPYRLTCNVSIAPADEPRP